MDRVVFVIGWGSSEDYRWHIVTVHAGRPNGMIGLDRAVGQCICDRRRVSKGGKGDGRIGGGARRTRDNFASRARTGGRGGRREGGFVMGEGDYSCLFSESLFFFLTICSSHYS